MPLARTARGARCAALAAIAIAMSATAPAAAHAARGAPDEHAAAREFSYAAYRLRVAITAQKAELDQRIQAGVDAFVTPPCGPAFGAMGRLSERRLDAATLVAATVAMAPALAAVRPAFERFLAELDRVRTGDRALRGGRAEWRATVAAFRRFPPQVDVCATLDAWRQARFARSKAPVGLGDADFAGSLSDPGADPSRRLARAARRMRRLGVPAGAARRFAGTTLFDGIGEDIDVPD
jgi:hypothetical protein